MHFRALTRSLRCRHECSSEAAVLSARRCPAWIRCLVKTVFVHQRPVRGGVACCLFARLFGAACTRMCHRIIAEALDAAVAKLLPEAYISAAEAELGVEASLSETDVDGLRSLPSRRSCPIATRGSAFLYPCCVTWRREQLAHTARWPLSVVFCCSSCSAADT